jgi:hypothetical protein
VLTLIDASQNPQAKTLLLSGQANIAVCPQCGHAGQLNAPLIYHDPEKELFFTYIPVELGLAEVEQERIIGDLTNRVLTALPAEKRKGYLLRPQSFLRLEAMIEAILEADGITPEMLQAQRDRVSLLERLLRTTEQDAKQAIVQESSDLIDYDFFQLLTVNLELAQVGGQEQFAQQLLTLRQQLLEWTKMGQEIAAREQAIEELGPEITREGLLDKLVETALAGQETKIETMVAFARPAIDYMFYQSLAERIQTAEKAGKTQEAQTLKALRDQILELTDQIDAELQQAAQESTRLLQQIVGSDDPEQEIRDSLELIDDLFLSVLATQIDTAEQSGHSDEAAKLRQVGNILMELIQESQPPEIRLINQLLQANDPESTLALLEANRTKLDAAFIELMQRVEEDLISGGRQQLAQRLAQIREQAVEIAG